ncbi:MAG TPA: hypothetical protein VL462_00160 [Candidatus Nitrosotalea sp.]|nr:hypothetical protein [Candidatus Nitrosotalea sp.]
MATGKFFLRPRPQQRAQRRHRLLRSAALFGAAAGAALIIASNAAQAADLSYTIGALPGPGGFTTITFNDANSANTISYDYQVTGGGMISDSESSGTPGQSIGTWLFGFHLGPGFSGSTAHLDLTLRNSLGNSLTPADFGITSNATPPGHPPPGTIGGGGRDAGLSNIATVLVPGHPDELRLLADLATATSTIDNEYDLFIQGLGFGGRSSFVIRGPIAAAIAAVPLPAALPLFAAALLGLGLFQRLAKRRRQRQHAADATADDGTAGNATA